MKTRLVEALRRSPEGAEAEKILRSCVHCGFCNATCPTYQLLGDELDGPRGRIYLIKQVLEGSEPGRQTQLHLDRCLSCRNCETTCPSGVQYSRLLEIGREQVNRRVPRPLGERLGCAVLRRLLLQRRLFNALLGLGRALRPLLGGRLKAAIPQPAPTLAVQARPHLRKVLLVPGCVQPGLRPAIDDAARIIFDRLGIECLTPEGARCCGALEHHLDAGHQALARARTNIDAWWPRIVSGEVEALCMTASGCGVMIRDYARLLAHDPDYADKARRVSERYRDPAEIVTAILAEGRSLAPGQGGQRIALHPPCTLQHGLRLRNVIEPLLEACGHTLLPFRESHLCCGSAGTYAITQKSLSRRLRERKLGHLLAGRPEVIATANIGCLIHLQAGTETPVRHWLELLV